MADITIGGLNVNPSPSVNDYLPISVTGMPDDNNYKTQINSYFQIIKTLNIVSTTSSVLGVIKQNNSPLLHTFGNTNLFLAGSGNFTLSSATQNIGIGSLALESITTNENNIAIGPFALGTLTTGGNGNIALGTNALTSLGTGSFNIAIGYAAGENYTGGEASCLLISNAGIASESNIARIGTTGSSAGQITDMYLAGIVHANVFDIPNTSSATVGCITQNGDGFLSTYQNNLFLGTEAGNFTMSIGCSRNTGIGLQTLTHLTTGTDNYVAAYQGGSLITTGVQNSIFAAQPFITTGSYNSLYGFISGSNYTGAEASNILLENAGVIGESNIARLGTTGSGPHQITDMYLAGNVHGLFVYDIHSVTTTPYNASSTDYSLFVNVSSASTVNIPAGSGSGRQFIITDVSGAAATNNITITPSAGTINGLASLVMNINNQSYSIMDSATNLWSIV